MADVKKAQDHRQPYGGIAEMATYSGLSVTTLRKRLAEIPHFRVGKKILFKKSEFDRWMEQQREHSEDLDLQRIADEAVSLVLGSDKTNEGGK